MTRINTDNNGLIPTIVQNFRTGKVLMLGYMNSDAISKTLDSGNVWFYSRSKSRLWEKGETSGNYLKVESISLDCDQDTILVKVEPKGPTCHTGEESCFGLNLDFHEDIIYAGSHTDHSILDKLTTVLEDRKNLPSEGSYTSDLLRGDIGRVAQKVIEEAGEAALSGARFKKDELLDETADLIYHVLVLLAANDKSIGDVWAVLEGRRSK